MMINVYLPIIFAIAVGLVMGVLLYMVIRHYIPFGRKGEIDYFTAGFIIYTLVVVGSWYL